MQRLFPAALAVAVVAAFAVTGCGGDDGKKKPKSPATPTSVLFVVEASSGTLTLVGGDEYTLTLNGLPGHVTGFSDRPQRITFNLDAGEFFADWQKNFDGDPPNAALDVVAGKRQADAVIVELRTPRFKRNSVSFKARKLKGASAGLSQYRDRLVKDPPRRFGDASLFIDGGGRQYVPLPFWFTQTSGSLHPEEPQPSGSSD